MDWATWFTTTYDLQNQPAPTFINVETTIHNLPAQLNYVAEKIDILRTIAESPGGFVECIRRLRQDARYARFPELERQPRLLLILASNKSDRLPEAAQLATRLRSAGGGFARADAGYQCTVPPSNTSALVVTLPTGESVFIGLLDKARLTELAHLAVALRRAKRHKELDERFLFDLSETTGAAQMLEPLPSSFNVEAPTAGQHIRVEGCAVTFQKFTISPNDMLRLSTVLRLIRDVDVVQRLPVGAHMEAMAEEVERGGRFPTPILAIVPDAVSVDRDAAQILKPAGGPVPPYSWHVVDGQHRVYCFYFVDRGTRAESLDVNAYSLTNSHDRGVVSSGLFLKVNYEALRPPIELALTHYAYSTRWRKGAWIFKKKSAAARDVDTKVYSSRVLAARLLLEMNVHSRIYSDFFKYGGSQDKGKTSLQSITTYLSDDWNLRDPGDARDPVARELGTIAHPRGPWAKVDPAPDDLGDVYTRCVADFDQFIESGYPALASPLGPPPKELLCSWTSKNNNVFVALWRLFHRYRFYLDGPGGARYIWPTASARVGRVLTALSTLASTTPPQLFGSQNRFRSGAGAGNLTAQLVAAFDAGEPSGSQLLAQASTN